MKNIVVRRDEEECCNDISEAIVIGIEKNDEDEYEEIWMDPENAIEFANDILRLSYIALYRYHNRAKNNIINNKIYSTNNNIDIVKEK